MAPLRYCVTILVLLVAGESFLLNSPHKALKHLDNSILKATKNVTQNPQMEDKLYQISKDLVSAILSKLEVQDKITRVTREALEAPGKSKGITAIETRRILDYISRTLSGNILSVTRSSTEPELHRLVYGLAQIAAEVSIVSALKDITYASALSKKQSVDLTLRKKRSIKTGAGNKVALPVPVTNSIPTIYDAILNKSADMVTPSPPLMNDSILIPQSPFSVLPRANSLHVLNTKPTLAAGVRGFLNQTALDIENNERIGNNTADPILIEKSVNGTHELVIDAPTYENQDVLVDDWLDPRDNVYKPTLNADVVAEINLDQPEYEEEIKNEKRAKLKMEKLEAKAKKAILYAGDVAYLTAASVVAMRRALTASIEVQMSVKYAKNGMANHQELMMNLAKTAAQQAGKEAKSASSKSLACERVIKLALKYTAQSHGAKLNHVANRIIMDSLSLATLAKSMAYVSSDIAINSLYQATDVKPPS
ncbi:uncharacterized protein LOC125234481 isoform X2 [Leguminivora glycinivorella]|uniref:uncharacterized protein LOC125234481 isoform X2 n=1 Tax=Leguminivora glycinivorella TaxID=1035111 RepID=UPI002010772E|nr:uncharacterized protein LOC125234481 isoform X2 [Leguminivora glycinivorella]